MGKLIELPTLTPSEVPVIEILKRISLELKCVADTLGDTQPLASSLDWVAVNKDVHFLQAVQQLDRMEQTLRGLEQVLTALVAHIPADLQANMQPALTRLTLSALAARLNGDGISDETEQSNSGDCDFF